MRRGRRTIYLEENTLATLWLLTSIDLVYVEVSKFVSLLLGTDGEVEEPTQASVRQCGLDPAIERDHQSCEMKC